MVSRSGRELWREESRVQEMAERRVVIFGGSGFIGQHLARWLAETGWTVRIAARHPQVPESAAGAVTIEAVSADLADELQVRAALRGADAIVNLVGIVRAVGRQGFDAVNVEGPQRLARLAASEGIARLLHVSALGIAEDAPSAADRSKAGGEAAVREALPSATLVRPSLVYGPGDHFFTRFAAMTRLSPVLPVIGGGRTRFQPIYIEDALRALQRLLERPETAESTLALVGPETFTFRELLERMLSAVHKWRLIVSLPFPFATALAAVLERLPAPLLTRDEVWLLETDKIAGRLPTPASLGLVARPLDEGLAISLAAPR
jgi:NADH dehydrogenase